MSLWLNFRTKELQIQIPEDVLLKLRAARLIAVGKWLTLQDLGGKKVIMLHEKNGTEKVSETEHETKLNNISHPDSDKKYVFEAVSQQVMPVSKPKPFEIHVLLLQVRT